MANDSFSFTSAGASNSREAERSRQQSAPEALRDFTADVRLIHLSVMAAVIGTAGAAAAWVLLHLIDVVTNLAYFGRLSATHVIPAGSPFGLATVLVPIGGCLIVGLMARFGSERIRGHGIPEAIEAILIGGSRIESRVALLKPISAAVSIGTGGPFGAEGPIIMTGGALGSLFGQLFHLSPAERKTLLVAGAAAGMSATFGTPVAAMLLAVELLLFEWKPRSFVPVAVAAILAALWRPWLFVGAAPLFAMTPSPPLATSGLALCLLLGIAGGVGSGLLTGMVYKSEDFFLKLPIHWMWWPLIGGVVIGVGGLIEPRALGVGYDTIGALLHGTMSDGAATRLLIVKSIIWAVALGSGTSGGVLAPLLIMGGVLGELCGAAFPLGDAPLWALIGMAAMMGGTMRAPLTALVFALELTHDFGAMVPLAIASTTAYATTVLLLKRSILTEKVARRGYHITREYSVDAFELMLVRDIMARPADTLPASLSIDAAVQFFTAPDAPRRHKSYPVLDASGRLIGMVSRADALRWLRQPPRTARTLAEVCDRELVMAYDDEPVARVVDRMNATQVGRIPVLRRADRALVGLVARRDLLRVRSSVSGSERDRAALIRLDLVSRSTIRGRAPR